MENKNLEVSTKYSDGYILDIRKLNERFNMDKSMDIIFFKNCKTTTLVRRFLDSDKEFFILKKVFRLTYKKQDYSISILVYGGFVEEEGNYKIRYQEYGLVDSVEIKSLTITDFKECSHYYPYHEQIKAFYKLVERKVKNSIKNNVKEKLIPLDMPVDLYAYAESNNESDNLYKDLFCFPIVGIIIE